MSLYPLITVSRLLKSCATPPASRPTLSSFWACWSCSRSLDCSSSARFRSVMSDHAPTASDGSARLVADQPHLAPGPAVAAVPVPETGTLSSLWPRVNRSALVCAMTLARSSGWMLASHQSGPMATSGGYPSISSRLSLVQLDTLDFVLRDAPT